jgi:two-component system response regulator FixJ
MGEHLAAIVDDECDIREVLTELLKSAGIQSRNYTRAEDLLEDDAEAFSCLILDIGLPGMSGLQLQSLIRQRSADVPIVIMSGQATASDAIRAYRANANAMFEKPFDHREMLATVQSLVLDWSAKQARREEIDSRVASLSPRERAVMDLLIAGHKTALIARHLAISASTVEKHRLRVFEKTGQDSVISLIHWLAERN